MELSLINTFSKNNLNFWEFFYWTTYLPPTTTAKDRNSMEPKGSKTEMTRDWNGQRLKCLGAETPGPKRSVGPKCFCVFSLWRGGTNGKNVHSQILEAPLPKYAHCFKIILIRTFLNFEMNKLIWTTNLFFKNNFSVNRKRRIAWNINLKHTNVTVIFQNLPKIEVLKILKIH